MKRNNLSISLFFKSLSDVVMFFFTRIYHIRANIPDEIKNAKEAYLLLANHVGFWDPFVIGYFLRKKPHFVASDAVMKDPVKRFFLTGFKIIPKKKNERDSQVIRNILEHLQNNEAVALFPEATRTWTGETLYIDESIGKLLKLAKVKVITAKTSGMFLFNPRWAYKIRKSGVLIDFEEIATRETIKSLDYIALTDIIRKKLYHNEWDYQKQHHIKIYSNKRAEYLNHTLFFCGNCKSIDGYLAKENVMHCRHCGEKILVDSYGFLQYQSIKTNIADAFKLQTNYFKAYIEDKIKSKCEESFFVEQNMLVYKSENTPNFEFIGKANLHFYADFIEISYHDGKSEVWNFSEIKTLNPQLKERIEMNTNNFSYRFIGEQNGVSGIKWEMAINIVWKFMGEEYKLSTYLKNIIL